jgi:hypothetical protein
MNTTINPGFSDQRAIYQKANETHNVDLVRQLNEVGMKPTVPSFSGPAIISNFMDIATKHDIILGFLKDLRQTNRLLTEKEFQPLSDKKWIQKYKLSRIMGCNHLMRTIKENNLQHIKIPLKVAVVDNAESLKVTGWEYFNLYDFNSDQIKIYAEKIERIERKLTRVEIDELIQVFAMANFTDLNPENILVAEDGIYFIDTECQSFSRQIHWRKMERFESLISDDDLTYFRGKVEEKMNEPETKKDVNEYEKLNYVLRTIKGLPTEAYKNEIEELENKISRLEYVGAKEVGSDCLRPNNFTFNLRDILT